MAESGRGGRAAEAILRWPLLHAEPQSAADCDAAPRACRAAEWGLSARAEHGPSARPVAHDDTNRKVGAALGPSRRAVRAAAPARCGTVRLDVRRPRGGRDTARRNR